MTFEISAERKTTSMRVDRLLINYKEYINPRTHTGLDKQSIHELADDIKRRGLEDPIVVVPVQDGDETVYVIRRGQRRLRAVTLLQWKEVDVVLEPVMTYSPKAMFDLAEGSLAADARGARITTAEEVAAAQLMLQGGRSQADVGRALNRSKAWMSTMIGAARAATPEVMEAWTKGKIPDEQFKDLASVRKEKQVDALADVITLREKGDRSQARQAAKKVAGRTEPKKAVSSGNASPSKRAIEEYAKLRRVPVKGPRHPYVRGMLDMAALAIGELSEDRLEGEWRRFLTLIASSSKQLKRPRRERGAKAAAKRLARARPGSNR